MRPDQDPHGAGRMFRAGAPLSEAKAGLALFHGRGAGAGDILRLAAALAPANVALVAPEAARMSWWPQSFLAPFAANAPYVDSALGAANRALDALEEGGLAPERIAVLGFSQGACLALEIAARGGRPKGGVLALSGGLLGDGERPGVAPPDDKSFGYETDLRGLPVFIGVHEQDPHIPLARIRQSEAAFERLGAAVETRVYPGFGHGVTDDEASYAHAFLARLAERD